jgi:hypothetical protein
MSGATRIAPALAAALLVAAGSARAGTLNACANNSNGKVNKIMLDAVPSCGAKQTPVSWTSGLSPLVAFARINPATNVAESFGGNGTTSVTVTDDFGIVGNRTVVFHGSYPAGIDRTKVVVLTTAQVNSFDVTNAYVSDATATEITVGINDWQSYQPPPDNGRTTVDFIAVFVAP